MHESLSIQLEHALHLRRRAYEAMLMAEGGVSGWEEFYRINRIAESAYLKLSAQDMKEFLKRIGKWTARV